jgi:hypothetical protein
MGCQLGFQEPLAEEAFKATGNEPIAVEEERNDGLITVKEEMQRLRERQQEIQDAIQESSPEEVHVREPARDSKGVGSPHTKEKETTKETKENKICKNEHKKKVNRRKVVKKGN